MKIKLPDLADYKSDFQLKAVILPLPAVETNSNGLLSQLPTIHHKNGWPWTEQFHPIRYNMEKEWPKITVITPSYNQRSFIEQTIRSVLLQNYPNLEYIIIDGGSDDGSVDIIKKYSHWLSYWETDKDRGQGHAINKGFSIASGTYFAWINSDDYYLAGTFFKVINKFVATKTDFVYGRSLVYNVDKQEFDKPAPMLPLLDYFLRIPSLAQPSCFWHCAIHQPIWEELHCCLDYELWLRVVKKHKRRLIDETLSVANSHDAAKTYDPKMKQKWHEDHLLICSEDAHGPVNDWNTRMLIYRIRSKIYKLFQQI